MGFWYKQSSSRFLHRPHHYAALAAALLLAMSGATYAAKVPLNPGKEAGKLAVSGAGALPNSRVSMQLTPQLTLTAVTDTSGNFTFTHIPYDFLSDLVMNFSIPVQDTKTAKVQNTLALKIKPTSFNVEAIGTATKAASIALNVGGRAAAAGVANKDAFFHLASPSKFSSMKSKDTRIIASIINVTEECCPRILKPMQPVTIYVQNVTGGAPVAKATTASTATAAPPVVSAPAAVPAPETAPETTEKPKNITPKPGTRISPRDRRSNESGELKRGEVIQTGSISFETGAYAASVDSTYVRDLRLMSDQLLQTILIQARMIGGFIDAQALLDAQRSLQILQARALKDYTPGEALCGFGTLSRSLAASDGRGQATKKAVNEIMIDRETLRAFTESAESAQAGQTARMRQFMLTYCSKTDEGNALFRFCSTEINDINLNRDVDYTRVIDTPLTLNIDFLGGAGGEGEEAEELQRNNASVLAIAKNLYANEPFSGFNYNDFASGKVLADDLQDMRSVAAARGVVRNSFASLVGQKARGTISSGEYMRTILTSMGLEEEDATELIGENPSYFAQMEILTKRIYQDPRFFAELYDKPANVDRQRAAMRGIGLAQQTDYLDMLHRREMLLSVLLELKLKNLDQKASGN